MITNFNRFLEEELQNLENNRNNTNNIDMTNYYIRYYTPIHWNFIGYVKQYGHRNNSSSVCLYYSWRNTFIRRTHILNNRYWGETRYTKFTLKKMFLDCDYDLNSLKPYHLNVIDKLKLKSILTERPNRTNYYSGFKTLGNLWSLFMLSGATRRISYCIKGTTNFCIINYSYFCGKDYIYDVDSLNRNIHAISDHDARLIKTHLGI